LAKEVVRQRSKERRDGIDDLAADVVADLSGDGVDRVGDADVAVRYGGPSGVGGREQAGEK
jgi:hypothetical protein